MFENIINFFKNIGKKEENKQSQENSKNAAKERLHLVLMQDRANVSADFLELMKQEIIDVIKKYIEIDEKEIDVRLTNKENEDGTNGAPALYANIPILNIKNDTRKITKKDIENKKNEKEQSEEAEQHENEEQKEIKDMTEKVEENNSQKEQNETETEVDTDKNIDNSETKDKKDDNIKEENNEKEQEEKEEDKKVLEVQESKA